MFKHITLFTTFVIPVTVGPSLAKTIATPNAAPMASVVDWLATQTAPAGFRAAELSSDSASPEQSLLAAIVKWLSSNFELPATSEYPSVRIVPASEIVTLRYGDFLSTSTRNSGAVTRDAAAPNNSLTVVAVYDPRTKTILLPEGWTGTTPAELSVLVHEMVHHLQNLAEIKFECPQALEQLAYAAQEKWLGLFGHNLLEDFDLDPLTLLVRTRCFF
ncbi:MAG: DUF6647 family protein [Rhodomicrobiaceae bacterium]